MVNLMPLALNTVTNNLQSRLDAERDRLMTLKHQHGQTALKAEEYNDPEAQAQSVNLYNEIAACNAGIAQLESALFAANDAQTVKAEAQQLENERKALAHLQALLREQRAAADAVDKSITRLATGLKRLNDTTAEIHQLTQRFPIVKYGKGQLVDYIDKPVKQFVSALASKMPPNTGLPRQVFNEQPVHLADMVVDAEIIKQFLITGAH